MALAALCFIVGYLVGSVPVGLLVSRLAGVDIRRYGTGNIGASNVLRNVGRLPAAVVAIASFAQGLVPALVVGLAIGTRLAVAAAAAGSVIGYGWSFLLSFRGGRAVGTATGALTAISLPGLVPLVTFYALGGLVRQPALGVLTGLVAYLGYLGFSQHPVELTVAAFVVVGAVLLKRLDGVRDDLRAEPRHHTGILLTRLVFDRRPGQRLVGRND